MVGIGIVTLLIGFILAFGSEVANALLSIANVETATNTVVVVSLALGVLAVLAVHLASKNTSLKPVGSILTAMLLCWGVIVILENLILTNFSGFVWSANNSTISKIGLVLIGGGAGMLITSLSYYRRGHGGESRRRRREEE